MPFQSEKQRRFLWAAHPEVAKRWAKDYPESNKGLPMYAPKKDDQLSDHSKAAAIAVLRSAMSNAANMTNLVNINLSLGKGVKLANSGMVKVPMPNSKQPTCAGEKPVTAKQNAPETADNAETPKQKDDAAVTALFGKLSAVLARPLREAIERMQAEDEARESRFVPENLGLRRYSAPSPSIMPPMGMAAAPGQPQPQPTAPPQAQAQAQPAQPANTPSNGPVGGGSNPQFNPINAFGAIGAKGQLNGNAAFGQKNSPDSLKIAYDWTGRRQSSNVEDLRGQDMAILPRPKMPPLRPDGSDPLHELSNEKIRWQADKAIYDNKTRAYNQSVQNNARAHELAGRAPATNPHARAVERFEMNLPKGPAPWSPTPAPPYGPDYSSAEERDNFFTNFHGRSVGDIAAPVIEKHLPPMPGPKNPIDEELGGMGRYIKTPLPTSNQIRQMPPLGATKTSALAFGEKISMPRGLGELPQGAGPDQIADAIMRFNQLRTLVRPTDETLRGHNLSRKGFQGSLRKITSHSQGKDKFDLHAVAPNPKLRAALTGLAGLGAAGGLAYTGNTDLALGALPATALAAGGAYLHGEHERGNVLNTARLMKQYGLLKPKLLQQAYPLLGDDYRVA